MRKTGTGITLALIVVSGCIDGEVPAGEEPSRAALSAPDETRLSGRFVERDVALLDRRPYGDAELSVTESNLLFYGDLEGTARTRTTRIDPPRGVSKVFRSIHFVGTMGRTPVDWHLSATGDASGGSLFITHDTPPSPAAAALGTFVDAGGGETVFELPMLELYVELEVSGQNSWTVNAPLWVSEAAADAPGGDPYAVLAPVIRVKHDYLSPLTINRTEVEYYVENGLVETTWEQDVVVPSAANWNVSDIDTRDDNFISDLPGPWAFVARIYVDGTTQPFFYANVAEIFEAPTSPFPVGGHLDDGVYFSGFTGHNGNDQRYGHDLWVRRWNGSKWTQLREGMDDSAPQNYLIWGLPVYAMEGGTVIECVDDQFDNPDTSEKDPVFDGSTNDPGGNHYKIQRPNGVIDLYAHMREGSVHCSRLGVGVTVHPGDYLGRVGNTGTGSPHLHVHAELANAPVPYYFSGVDGIDWTALWPPVYPAPWVPLDGRAIQAHPDLKLLRVH
jgi:murein DD-endopeptidase MepM/ murein hydrolase activator NlpD